MAPITKRYLSDNPSQSIEDSNAQNSVGYGKIRKVVAPEPRFFSHLRAINSNQAVFSSLPLKKNYEVNTKQIDRIFSIDSVWNKSSVTKSSMFAERPPEEPQAQLKMQTRTRENREDANALYSVTQYSSPSLSHATKTTKSDLSVAPVSSVAAVVNNMKSGYENEVYSVNSKTTESNSITIKIGKISLNVLPAQKQTVAPGLTRKSPSSANRNKNRTVNLSRYYIKGF